MANLKRSSKAGENGIDFGLLVVFGVFLIALAAFVYLVDWAWSRWIAPLGLPSYATIAIILTVLIATYVYAIWQMATNRIAHRVDDVRQKVRDDLQFIAIYSLIVDPVILIAAAWYGELRRAPEYIAIALVLGIGAKLKSVLSPSEFR